MRSLFLEFYAPAISMIASNQHIRFRAVAGKPLEQYFHGDYTLSKMLGKKGIEGMSVFKRNMYLAEDRILCFEIIAKTGSKWHTKMIQTARAETDIPATMVEFIYQRRRWLNGALTVALYSLLHFGRTYISGHYLIRMVFLHIQLLYNVVTLITSWFSIAFFFLSTFTVTDITGNPPEKSGSGFPFGKATPVFNAVLQTIYSVMLVLQFIVALGDRPRNSRLLYVFSFIVFAFIQVYFLINVLYLGYHLINLERNTDSGQNYAYIANFYADIGKLVIWITSASVFGGYIAIGFLRLSPWHLFAYPQYLFVASCYTNVLNIYALCNIDDVSWGTKGAHSEQLRAVVEANKKKEGRTGARSMTATNDADLRQPDIDQDFEQVVRRALSPPALVHDTQEKTLSDSFTSFKTKLVAVYIFSNFFLCLFVTNESFDQLKFLVRMSSTHRE